MDIGINKYFQNGINSRHRTRLTDSGGAQTKTIEIRERKRITKNSGFIIASEKQEKTLNFNK